MTTGSGIGTGADGHAAAGSAPAVFTRIPDIDLRRAQAGPVARAQLADELCRICHHVGFFTITGHGIDPALLDAVFAHARRLFALPLADRQRIDKRRSRHFRGWESEGSEYTNGRPDIRQQVDLWSEHPARAADVQPHYLRLLGPNQWLPETLLPGFRASMDAWFLRLGALADDLLQLLALGLELPPDTFARLFVGERMALTKLIRYPPTPPGQFGVNAHHDTGFVTLLAPGDVAGLQVENPDGHWVDVPARPSALVVNLGEMLQAMTGNYFVATPHRVVAAGVRYAVGYFHGPALSAPLVALPLAPRFVAAVAASPRHANAGFMARREETAAGVGDMRSSYRAAVYGEQLWNYFLRSYPDNVRRHYGE